MGAKLRRFHHHDPVELQSLDLVDVAHDHPRLKRKIGTGDAANPLDPSGGETTGPLVGGGFALGQHRHQRLGVELPILIQRLDRLLFEEVWKQCGIMIEKAPRPENCIYDDFEGYCACREEDREKWGENGQLR